MQCTFTRVVNAKVSEQPRLPRYDNIVH